MNRRLNIDIPQNNTYLLPRDVLSAPDHLIGERGEIRLPFFFIFNFIFCYSDESFYNPAYHRNLFLRSAVRMTATTLTQILLFL
jgi:hypothetical protein